jgi:hypothetical protein
MLIRLSDPSLADPLCAHFRRSRFKAELVGGSMVKVGRSDALSVEQERCEVEIHLRIWRSVHPDVQAEPIG